MDSSGWDEVFDDGGPADPGWGVSGWDSWPELSGDDGLDLVLGDYVALVGEDDFVEADLTLDVGGEESLGAVDDLPELVPLDDRVGQDPWEDWAAGRPGSVPGTDPDVSPLEAFAAGWGDPVFPPVLELADPPTPVDGWPWGDAALLGSADPAGVGDLPGVEWSVPSPGDLAAYGGLGSTAGADWAGLIGSDDPAVSGLARWWSATG